MRNSPYAACRFKMTTSRLQQIILNGNNICCCIITNKIDNAGIADVSLKQTYLPGTDEGAFDIDLHFVINKGDSGVYTYIVWNHAATYPATHVDENRFVWKINQSQTEVICQDSARTWQMPNAYDYANATKTGYCWTNDTCRQNSKGSWFDK